MGRKRAREWDPRRDWPWSPRPNPTIDEVRLGAPIWIPLRRDGRWSGYVRKVLRGRAGVYALIETSRNDGRARPLYVGSSSFGGYPDAKNPDQFFKQILRHFYRHEPSRASGITPIWTDLRKGIDLDVALWLTPPDAAYCVEGRIIADLEPLHAKQRDYSSCDWLAIEMAVGRGVGPELEDAPF